MPSNVQGHIVMFRALFETPFQEFSKKAVQWE